MIGKPLQALVAALLISATATAVGGPQITTDAGIIEGTEEKGIMRFLGVRYAAAPEGELRWRPPQPVEPWEGVRDKTSYGHPCPQPFGGYPDWATDPMREAGLDEDCLTINIWAPADAGDEPLPVMFYIHGGNMYYGSNVMPLYDGSDLASKGVVAVFINYRLGYLGRFAHPALSRLQADEPLMNYGTMDQIAALDWVQRNIAQFGGDPDNVTIYGHSAGGVSVNYLMTTPQSEGLFHKAIAQGSGVLLDRDPHMTESFPRGIIGYSGEQVGELFARRFNISGSDEEVAAALRAVSWQDIIAYQKELMVPFNPFVDGKVVTKDLVQVFEDGEQHDVPYIGGANSWEQSAIDPIPFIGRWFMAGAFLAGMDDDDLAPFDDQWTRVGVSDRWYAEGLFLLSTRHLARQMSTVSSPAWQFRVTYIPTAARGEVPGAPHGQEMPWLFGQIEEHPEYQRPKIIADTPASDEDLKWGNTLQAYWLNFAKTGNPNGPGLPEWPQYTPENDLTLEMNAQFEPVSGLDKDALDYLEERAMIRRERLDALEQPGQLLPPPED